MRREQKTKYAILGALSIRPMSGYDIKQWVVQATGSFWSESSGQVYPKLAMLLDQGLISIDELQEDNGGRQRKVYAITKNGLEILINWLIMPAEKTAERNELRLKLFYGKLITKEDYLTHVERLKVQMKEALAHFKKIEQNIKNQYQDDENLVYWLLTLRCGVLHAKAELDWCEEAIRTVKGD